MDMLCIAAQGDPIGKLSINGDPLSHEDLARMTGGDVTAVGILIGELERNGVFSRDRNGAIYSRRIMADVKKAATARKNGKEGGNPKLRKQKENGASDNPMDKGEVKPQEPRAKSQPVEPSGSPGKSAPAESRRVRSLEGFFLDEKDLAWAAEDCSNADPHRALVALRDYCAANGRKYADYRAAWRNFMRRDHEDAGKRKGYRPGGSASAPWDNLMSGFGAAATRTREDAGIREPVDRPGDAADLPRLPVPARRGPKASAAGEGFGPHSHADGALLDAADAGEPARGGSPRLVGDIVRSAMDRCGAGGLGMAEDEGPPADAGAVSEVSGAIH
jgi:hypothetical protein